MDDNIAAHFVVHRDRGKNTQYIFLKIVIKSSDAIVAVAKVGHIKTGNGFVRIFRGISIDQNISMCVYNPDIRIQIGVERTELFIDLIERCRVAEIILRITG